MNRVHSSNISTPMQISPSPLQSTRAANSPSLPLSAPTPLQQTQQHASNAHTPQSLPGQATSTNAIQELQNLELLPLIMDLIEDVNTGKILPKNIANHSKNLIQIKINRARDILTGISGLSETPEERISRIERLQKNITNKNTSLELFKTLVLERLGESNSIEADRNSDSAQDVDDDDDDNDDDNDVEMAV